MGETESEKEARRNRSGKIVRLSETVTNYLTKRRKKGESFDACLRRQFGLADRRGRAQSLATYFVLENFGNPIIKKTLADARGEAIVQATKRKLGIKKAEAVKEVREVPHE